MTETDFSQLSDREARDLLLTWRHNDERRGPDTVELGARLLAIDPNAFGDKLWDVYEYVALAAMDCAKTDLAKLCVARLRARFPNSQRVNKLEAVFLESEGNLDDAKAIYKEMLAEDPLYQDAHKRLIAIAKAQGDRAGAIQRLTTYLAVYMADHEAWKELATLHMEEQRFDLAAFCLEELILANPHDDAYFTLFGEVQYALQDFLLARKYFAKAVEINPKNVHALMGLHQSCVRYQGTGQADNEDLANWARDRLVHIYRESDKLEIVHEMLQSCRSE